MIAFIIFGVILLLLSFSLKNNPNPFSKFSNSLKIVGFLLIALGIFYSMFKQIDAGKVGVKSLYGNDSETRNLFDCCIDIDRISENTFQNSRETYFWARDLNLNSLLVVTSNYHIPRVKLEFSRFFYEDNLSLFNCNH